MSDCGREAARSLDVPDARERTAAATGGDAGRQRRQQGRGGKGQGPSLSRADADEDWRGQGNAEAHDGNRQASSWRGDARGSWNTNWASWERSCSWSGSWWASLGASAGSGDQDGTWQDGAWHDLGGGWREGERLKASGWVGDEKGVGRGGRKAGKGGSQGKGRGKDGRKRQQEALSAEWADKKENEGDAGARNQHASEGEASAEDASVAAVPPVPRAPEGVQRRERKPRNRGDHHNGRGDVALDATATVAERLSDQLGRGAYDCMICLGQVGRNAAIWSCGKCWAAFHLGCIHNWVRKSNNGTSDEYSWPCPGCRYHHVGPMPDYTCFCGKLFQPEANPHWLAHSCGEVCERSRGCLHPCPELCHPGPCSRCTGPGQPGRCHCGREQFQTSRCGDPVRWSCGGICERPLTCGRHSCPLRCHTGECPACPASSMQPCFCGAQRADIACGMEQFTCGGTCGKPLDCGSHTCERPCHPGQCGPCSRDPASWGDRCACGKTRRCSVEAAAAMLVRWAGTRSRCSDPLPLCGQLCSRPHEGCGHLCQRPCHEGACGPCGETVPRDCRCGRTSREISCGSSEEVLCANVCKAKKKCGNHRCDTVCCRGYNSRNHEEHMCLLVCGRPLGCGSHDCSDFCHLGKCQPCRILRHEPLTCACGESSIEPPVPCGTVPPACARQCLAVMDCGHTCPASCHFDDHPICCELVNRQCLGGHREMRYQRCHVGAISCGQSCGRALPCRHTCSSQCHAGDCPPCTRACGARRVHCDHWCEAPCHPDTECEDMPCKRKVKVACACGMRVEERLCGAHSAAPRPQFAALKCAASCERPLAAGPQGSPSAPQGPAGAERDTYMADFYQLAVRNRRYVQMLEDQFFSALRCAKPAPMTLPACDTARRLLAVEYARLYWRMRTSSRADSAHGWWVVQVEPTAGARPPQTLLSQLQAGSSRPADGPVLLALGSQPRLRFIGLRGAGDEIYDLVGLEGLLGVRPGGDGEVFAFADRSATAAAAYRRLTGLNPGTELAPVRSSNTGSAWGAGPAASGAVSGLRVAMEQSLAAGPQASAPSAPPSSGHSQGGDASGRGPQIGKGPEARAPERVPDAWDED